MMLKTLTKVTMLCGIVVLTAMGNLAPSHLLAAEDTFGKPVSGLAVAVQLEPAKIRPGKRVLAHVLARNVSDKPIRIVRPQRGHIPGLPRTGAPKLIGWEITAAGRSRKLAPTEKASAWKPDPTFVLTIPPRQTVLLMSRRLEAAFDLSANGEYHVQYKLSLTRGQLAMDAGGNKLWANIVKAGVWTGSCAAAPARLTVDPKAPIIGRSRSMPVKVAAADKTGIWIDALLGDSSLYPGQVVKTSTNARLRVVRLVDFRRWLLAPVPPLKAKSIRAGDKLRVEEEDHHWMRSSKLPAKGRAMSGLKLVLEMDATNVAAGQTWTGKLRMVNAGKQPVHVSTLGGLLINLHTSMGTAPKIVACLGRGFAPEKAEIEKSRKVIKPGQSILLLQLQKPQPKAKSTLGGRIGNNWVEWKVGPGRYELSFQYRMSLESVADFELRPVFTGIVHSNVVEIMVRE